MKKSVLLICLFTLHIAAHAHAADLYLFDASGTMQKFERFFLDASQCTLDGRKLPPIETGEYLKVPLKEGKPQFKVLCKIDRALDVTLDIVAGKHDVYLELTTSRYKRSTLKRVFTLPDNFNADYSRAD